MIQSILIGILFAGALIYLGNMIRKQFRAKDGACGKGCSCSALDLEKIEKEMKATKTEG